MRDRRRRRPIRVIRGSPRRVTVVVIPGMSRIVRILMMEKSSPPRPTRFWVKKPSRRVSTVATRNARRMSQPHRRRPMAETTTSSVLLRTA